MDYYKLAALWTTSYPLDNSANPNIDYLPPYFDKRPMLFSLLCPNNEKAATEGGGRRINDAVEREKTAFLTRANLGLGQEVN